MDKSRILSSLLEELSCSNPMFVAITGRPREDEICLNGSRTERVLLS
jgi:hypothetical protein